MSLWILEAKSRGGVLAVMPNLCPCDAGEWDRIGLGGPLPRLLQSCRSGLGSATGLPTSARLRSLRATRKNFAGICPDSLFARATDSAWLGGVERNACKVYLQLVPLRQDFEPPAIPIHPGAKSSGKGAVR